MFQFLRHRVFVASMLGLLLLAGSGVSVSRMTCLMSGLTVVELGRMADECDMDGCSSDAAWSPVCCVAEQVGGALPVYTGPSPQVVPALIALPVHGLLVPAQRTFSVPVPKRLSARPPPLDTGDRLAVLRTHRI